MALLSNAPVAPHEGYRVLIELGAAIVVLALLARLASRWSISAIPLYLILGLCFGNGGLAPLNLSKEFTSTGAEIGVLLLLFMLGLEYSGEQLRQNLRKGLAAGALDFVLNFAPGLIAGLLLGWGTLPALLLGGVTYISSSGIVAKILNDLKRLNNAETPGILSVLILEDLAMAVYLPLVAVLLAGGTRARIVVSVSVAVLVVLIVLFIALRFGQRISRLFAHESDEIVLLTIFGVVVLVAGLAERLQVSSAIGAFLVGIAVTGSVAHQASRLLAPLRDLFAAIFFFFFGLEVDPHTLPAALPVAMTLAVVTALTKVATGYWTARHKGVDRQGCLRSGFALVPRGEFSIVIAGLGVVLEPRLGPISAAYVLLLAILGPFLARV
ncbi:cation:proton antiporter [Alloacidobacterium dinghuense]|uniref:Cation:proton antiporter n=1 Tax=Alloacidobacterium dinghuense TaxID=2763107 RepID=A0A7G8BQN8_9BACT|nr:cation:proton antiporter [Alloacidobacterium dinghuense]